MTRLLRATAALIALLAAFSPVGSPPSQAQEDAAELRNIGPSPEGVDPAAHEAFLAWVREYARSHPSLGPTMEPCQVVSPDLREAGFQSCWAWGVIDSSSTEHLYEFQFFCAAHHECRRGEADIPDQGRPPQQCWPFRQCITRARVFWADDRWHAEEAPFQAAVGASLEDAIERRQRMLADFGLLAEMRELMRSDDSVVYVHWPLGMWGSDPIGLFRFTKGEDGRWREYAGFSRFYPGFGLPDDALIYFAFADGLGNNPIAGECAQTYPLDRPPPWCWARESDRGNEAVYVLRGNPTGDIVVTLARGAPGWSIVDCRPRWAEGCPGANFDQPEQALMRLAFLNGPGNPAAGECAQNDALDRPPPWCWTLQGELGDEAVYILRDPRTRETVVTIARGVYGDPGVWNVVDCRPRLVGCPIERLPRLTLLPHS